MFMALPADEADKRADTLACMAHGPGAGGCCLHHLYREGIQIRITMISLSRHGGARYGGDLSGRRTVNE